MLEINSPRNNPDFKEEVLTGLEWLVLDTVLEGVNKLLELAEQGNEQAKAVLQADLLLFGFASEDFETLKEITRKVEHNAG